LCLLINVFFFKILIGYFVFISFQQIWSADRWSAQDYHDGHVELFRISCAFIVSAFLLVTFLSISASLFVTLHYLLPYHVSYRITYIAILLLYRPWKNWLLSPNGTNIVVNS